MKKIVFFMLLTLSVVACNKKLSRTVKKEDAPHINVAVGTIDSVDSPPPVDDHDSTSVGSDDPVDSDNNDGRGSDEISASDENEHAVYTFMGVSGVYFGCSSTFKSDKESLEFIFGTSKTTNLTFTREEFEQLIHV